MASLKKKITIGAQKKSAEGTGQRTKAKAYEKAVFYQESAKKEAGAQKYLTDVKTNLRNAGYNPNIVKLGREYYSGRATVPVITMSKRSMAMATAAGEGFGQAPSVDLALKGGYYNARDAAKRKNAMTQNTTTKGKSLNKKAK